MHQESLIAIHEFCSIHQIEFSFIDSLKDYGLIEIINIDNNDFIDERQLPALEKAIRMYNELGINLEGIDTINYLLGKISSLQRELDLLKNRIRFYEDID